jgi:hypothetical protein
MKVKVDAEADPAQKELLIAEWNLHKIQAEVGYRSLQEDSAYGKCHSDVEVLTFDLEKSLPTPVLSTGVINYKRQLWTYNQGIHDCSTEQGYMHMWHEGIASRGSHEVGSCILAHLMEMQTNATKLIVYSDACGGQNRNIYLVLMWLHIVSNDQFPFTSIDHKFMISGHSYLPNDRDFGHIELSRKKTTHIYIPDDWEKVVVEARHKNPFQIRRMKRENFVSLKDLKKAIVNRKVNTLGHKVEWLKIQWISVCKEQSLQFQYRYSHNTLEAWKTVDLKRKTKGRPPDLGRLSLPQLYTGPRPINKKKVAGLLQLEYVPPVYHSFYTSLNGTADNSDIEHESDSDED